jgi:hypothetical protein
LKGYLDVKDTFSGCLKQHASRFKLIKKEKKKKENVLKSKILYSIGLGKYLFYATKHQIELLNAL